MLVNSLYYLPEHYLKKINVIIAGDDKGRIINTLLQGKNTTMVTTILRWIDDDEMKYLFLNCDVVMLPYKKIYQSGIIEIAYDFKKPVIVSDHEIFCEYVRAYKSGILFKNGNPRDLAQKIRGFIECRYDFELENETLRNKYYCEEEFDKFVSAVL